MASDKTGPQPKGKPQKGAGGHDAKLTKRNKNVSSALPDRQKEAKEVAEVSGQMAEQGDNFLPWQRAVIELQLQGWSFEAIIRKGMEARQNVRAGKRKEMRWAKIPARRQFFQALKDQPGYKEACTYAFNYAVECLAQETIGLTRELDQVPDLKGRDLVDAKYKRILASMNIAERRLASWQRDQQGETEVIVFEPYGGWIPTNTIKGSPGQGAEAESAAERWRKMREEAKDA